MSPSVSPHPPSPSGTGSSSGVFPIVILLSCLAWGSPSPASAQAQPTPTPRADSLLAAAESGRPEAQYAFGRLHETGTEGFSVDYSEAMEWYRLAAGQNHVPAMLSLSTMLLGSDPPEAMRLVLAAAEMGSADAQWRAGQVYAGRIYVPLAGLDLDRDEALRWFTLGAEQGHRPSQEALADLYTETEDPSGYSRGEELYRLAAEDGGSAWAMLRLGMIYATGEGVVEDDDQARAWLSRLGPDYRLDPDLFSNPDLEVLGGLQSYYGVDFVGRVTEEDPLAAAEAFTIALESVQGMMFRPFIHPSFARTAERMLQKLQN